jgi:hypothetical protein
VADSVKHSAKDKEREPNIVNTGQAGEARTNEMQNIPCEETPEIFTSPSSTELDEEMSDTPPTAGWSRTIGEGGHTGYIYKWAGNVAHLDLKMVGHLS